LGFDDEPPLKIHKLIQKSAKLIKSLILKIKKQKSNSKTKLVNIKTVNKKIKKYRKYLWTKLYKNYKISQKALTNLEKRQFYALTIILILSICSLTTSYSSFLVQNETTALRGDKQILENSIRNINKYIPYLKDKKFAFQEEKKLKYIQKPNITKTESREKIEKIKKQKQLAQVKKRNVYSRYTKRNYQKTKSTKPAKITSKKRINTYYYGYCTWYAAQKRPDIPNQLGNGGSWYYNAQKKGLATGREPRKGSIIVTSESWAGHVGYVEKIEGNKVIISEMNYNGWGKVNKRTLDKNSAVIKGYIY